MNPKLVRKTMFSPYLCHITQSIVIKEGKNDRIVWDGSTVMKPTDIVMIQITPVDQESPATFGHVKSSRSTLISTIQELVIHHS